MLHYEFHDNDDDSIKFTISDGQLLHSADHALNYVEQA